MGLTVLEIGVGNVAVPEATRDVEFLIDFGAVYSVVPASILEELKIKPIAEQSFRLADGSKIVRKKGGALFRYGDQVGGADVIFGEEGDSTLLARLHPGSPRPGARSPEARTPPPAHDPRRLCRLPP